METRDAPGKAIYITFKDDKTPDLLVDRRCMGGDNEEICKPCKLKFKCFSSDALRIPYEELLKGNFILYPTVTELVDTYRQANGVDLTKCEACAKLVKNEETEETDGMSPADFVKKLKQA